MPLLFDTELARRAGENYAPIVGASWVQVMKFGLTDLTKFVDVPPNTLVKNIYVVAKALRNTGTSATLIVGDAGDLDGYFIGVNLKATDLLANESISFYAPGGKAGAYLVTPGSGGHVTNNLYPTGGKITATIADVGTAPTTGEHYVVVEMVTYGSTI